MRKATISVQRTQTYIQIKVNGRSHLRCDDVIGETKQPLIKTPAESIVTLPNGEERKGILVDLTDTTASLRNSSGVVERMKYTRCMTPDFPTYIFHPLSEKVPVSLVYNRGLEVGVSSRLSLNPPMLYQRVSVTNHLPFDLIDIQDLETTVFTAPGVDPNSDPFQSRFYHTLPVSLPNFTTLPRYTTVIQNYVVHLEPISGKVTATTNSDGTMPSEVKVMMTFKADLPIYPDPYIQIEGGRLGQSDLSGPSLTLTVQVPSSEWIEVVSTDPLMIRSLTNIPLTLEDGSEPIHLVPDEPAPIRYEFKESKRS